MDNAQIEKIRAKASENMNWDMPTKGVLGMMSVSTCAAFLDTVDRLAPENASESLTTVRGLLPILESIEKQVASPGTSIGEGCTWLEMTHESLIDGLEEALGGKAS